MRSIRRTAGFKRDLKRESKGRYRFVLKNELLGIVEALANDSPLDVKYRDHALTGDMAGLRECHIRPDLLLIYRYAHGLFSALRELERDGLPIVAQWPPADGLGRAMRDRFARAAGVE